MSTTSTELLTKSFKINNKTTKNNIVTTLKENIKSITCSSINEELRTKHRFLKFLGSGTSGYTISICNDNSCKKPVVLKYAKMSKKKDSSENNVKNVTHPINVEVLFNELFSDIIQKKMSPHLNIFYGSITCPSTVLLNNPNITGKWISKLKNNLSTGDIFDSIKLLFIEQGYKDLDEYMKIQYTRINKHNFLDIPFIKDLEREFRVILFQICYTLVTLQYNIVGFRHNDFKANNILVYKRNRNITVTDYYKYTILNKTYYIPATFVTIKFNDYDFSCSKEHDNHKLHKKGFKKSGLSCKPNPGYDLHMLLNYIYNKYIIQYKDLNNIKLLIEFIITNKKYLVPDSEVTRHFRLNNYNKYKTLNYNNSSQSAPASFEIFPTAKEVKTPAFLLDSSKIFSVFEKVPTNGNIIDTFDSQVPNSTTMTDELKHHLFY